MLDSRVQELPTPVVLVDLDVLEQNIARMASRARDAGVKLRPHTKTHRCLEITRLQLAAGAAGPCVAKVGEAEVLVRAGFDYIFLAYPVVGEDKGRRLLALADRARLAVGVDHACVVANLHDRLIGVCGDRVEAVLPVAARGRVS